MKTLAQHMNEALKIGKNLSKFSTYSCQPTSKKELVDIIRLRISKEGPNCDLNDIDTSFIEDMSHLFDSSDFNGDISEWNVSGVTDMSYMFVHSEFNQSIGDWDVSNVKNMVGMFKYSDFNQDISDWNINKYCNTKDMFYQCPIKDEYKPEL